MRVMLFVCMQTLVTNELEGGDRQRAMKRLRVPPLGAAQVRPPLGYFYDFTF